MSTPPKPERNDSKKKSAWRIFGNIRPSYLLLLTAAPFVIYLFVSAPGYQSALQFILPGVWTTVVVTVLAYIGAAVLGLVLAGLLILEPGRYTLLGYVGVALLLFASSAFFFVRPNVDYVLVGEAGGRVAIIQGTPGALTNTIQQGNYAEGAPEWRIRAVTDVEGAFEQLAEERVTALFIPAEDAPDDLDVLWEVSFLPSSAQQPAIATLVFAVIVTLLSFAGWQSGAHPLAIFAELYVDMIRGIPMLVIILYVGFPLQGAIRDVTGGFVEPSRLVRGTVAIALGYAAYLAEIFRAGIEAIPKGQAEAARSLGLSGWQTARFVIIPQAIRIVVPPLGNEFIAMLKDTSLLSLLSLREITQRTREFSADTFEYFPAYNTVALLYIGLTLAASSLVKFAERRTQHER